MSSRNASSSSPNFCASEVCTPSQYSQPITAETATAMISFVKRLSLPGSITVLTLFQFASKYAGLEAMAL
jgi:hypothetical protein